MRERKQTFVQCVWLTEKEEAYMAFVPKNRFANAGSESHSGRFGNK